MVPATEFVIESRGGVGGASFHPYAGTSRHERLVRKCAYAAFERAVEPLHSAFSSFRLSIRHSREGGNPEGKGGTKPHPNTSNDQASFSYLGVPAPAGMGDWYESMSRTPIRDVPSNQP